ncbi:unnamed protein product, partial [Thelazia callipaeda]|uniref:Troponin T n=1 Tax=Thelazia callipaeda TaxID=103827 RepID=A0A0N5D256_THECL
SEVEEEEEEEEEEVEDEEVIAGVESEVDEDNVEDEQSEFTSLQKKVSNDDKDSEAITEASKAVLAAKKRQEEDNYLQYEARRKAEREKVEEELRNLREKQERRRREREKEERELAEKMRIAEEKHRQEEEESKARMEAQKRKREEERRKKQAILAGSLAGIVSLGSGLPNFVVNIEKSDRNVKLNKLYKTSINKNKKNAKSKEEEEKAKRAYMAAISERPDVSQLLVNDLKAKIKQVHSYICELEALKYDLEKRHDRQLYDLKELHEREKQVARHRALQRGLDPNEAVASPHPIHSLPKINVASKFERQFDRRSYSDRRTVFEKPAAKPLPIVHGTARPPPEWGRTENEELEQLRKILEPHKYIEQVKLASVVPPIPPIPLSIPDVE